MSWNEKLVLSLKLIQFTCVGRVTVMWRRIAWFWEGGNGVSTTFCCLKIANWELRFHQFREALHLQQNFTDLGYRGDINSLSGFLYQRPTGRSFWLKKQVLGKIACLLSVFVGASLCLFVYFHSILQKIWRFNFFWYLKKMNSVAFCFQFQH